ncbi:SpoIIE family protein phosphatase [Saccharothrix sp. BKS2]|uniref:SpoIIE family protein phosphatase n=1 Tax=Saccharothrix sp. BKS2 TaxID=3064400 RepID=UPI0039EA5E0C
MDPDSKSALTPAGDPASVVACFEELPAAVWAFRGPDLVVVAANRAARASVGDRPGLVGRPVRESVPEAAGQQVFDLIEQCYTGDRVVLGSERRVLVDRDGDGRLEERFFTFTCLPSRDEHGVVTGVVAHAVEVTGQVTARRDAEQRHQAAQHVVHVLQRALLPDALPVLPGVRLAARYVVAGDERAAGGDWFDVVPLSGGGSAGREGGRVVLLVGDVVGHGPSAAAAMGQLRTVALHALWSGAGVEGAVAQLDAFAARLPATRAATMCLVELDTATGDLCGVNRGHPPALVVAADGSTRFLTGSGHDAPLGVGRPASTPWRDRLGSDDALLLYSDGLVERSGRSLAAGLSALATATAAAVSETVDEGGTLPRNPADRLCLAAVERMGWLGYEDDVTVLVARRPGLRQPPLHLVLPATPAALVSLRHGIADWLADLDVDRDRVFAVQHAIGEAVTNAVEHAYAGGPGPGPGEVVVVDAHLSDDGFAEFAVTDRGRWRPVPESPGGRGRGLALMRHFADRVEMTPSEGGTTVRMAFRLTRVPHLDHPEHPEQPAARPADDLTSELRRGAHPVLTVRGAIDAHTAELLHTALLDASRGGGRPLVVDLTGVTHLASAGVRLLHEVAGELDAELVAPVDSAAGQVLALTDLRHRPDLPEPAGPPEPPARPGGD